MAIGKEVISNVEKYGCEAGARCWLRCGREYCGVCKKGDHEKWRIRCDAERVASGMKPFSEVIEALKAKS